jgi:hypothetical protein
MYNRLHDARSALTGQPADDGTDVARAGTWVTSEHGRHRPSVALTDQSSLLARQPFSAYFAFSSAICVDRAAGRQRLQHARNRSTGRPFRLKQLVRRGWADQMVVPKLEGSSPLGYPTPHPTPYHAHAGTAFR